MVNLLSIEEERSQDGKLVMQCFELKRNATVSTMTAGMFDSSAATTEEHMLTKQM